MLTIIEKVLLLQNIELFSFMTSEQLSFLAAIAEEIPLGAARTLYRENDAPDGLYVVVSGSVGMRRGAEQIDRIGPNGSFGVWALFDDQPRLTTAETLEVSHLLFVPRDDFYEVLSDHVDIVGSLFKHLVQRLRRLATAAERYA
jgi:CRP-like cAMP-binding protein